MSAVSSSNPIERSYSESQDKLNKTSIIDYYQQDNVDKCKRSAYILSCVAAGAGVGALWGGLPTEGIGALPGAGIGAGVGFFVGLTTAATYDCIEYLKWSSSQSDEVKLEFRSRLMEQAGEDCICAITQEPIMHGVKTPYTHHRYEKAALQKWVSENGTCPMTRQPLTVAQIEYAPQSYGVMRGALARVIESEKSKATLSAEAQIGIELANKEIEENAIKFTKDMATRFLSDLEKRKMTLEECRTNLTKLFDDVARPNTNEDGDVPQ